MFPALWFGYIQQLIKTSFIQKRLAKNLVKFLTTFINFLSSFVADIPGRLEHWLALQPDCPEPECMQLCSLHPESHREKTLISPSHKPICFMVQINLRFKKKSTGMSDPSLLYKPHTNIVLHSAETCLTKLHLHLSAAHLCCIQVMLEMYGDLKM